MTIDQARFPRTALELIFDLEADRIRDLVVDLNMIASERGVVASELGGLGSTRAISAY